MKVMNVMITISSLLLINIVWQLLYSFVVMELTNSANMETMIKTQETFIDALKSYVKREEERIDHLKKQLAIQQSSQKEAFLDRAKFAENPINVYKLTKKLTIDATFILKKVNSKTKFVQDEKVKHPSKDDLTSVKETLLNLQNTYRLNVTHLANGELTSGKTLQGKSHSEIQPVAPMSASDCYELGLYSFDKEDYVLSTAWFVEALNKFDAREAEACNITNVNILDHLENSYRMFGDLRNCAILYELTITPIPQRYGWIVKRYRELAAEELINMYKKRDAKLKELMTSPIKKKEKDTDIMDIKLMFDSLCRGENNLTKQKLHKLSCYYAYGPHPYLKLARIKAELLHREPDIIMFHQVISNDEIRAIQSLAKTRLVPASPWQTIRMAMITDEESDAARRLSKRVGHFTGLNMSFAEPLQTSLYGFGDFFMPHYDYMSNFGFFRGDDRLATILFYMSDVSLGGATVFVDQGVTVFPVKGSALYWKNKHSSGKTNLATLHGTCPVLHGTKWVAAKWIHNVPQQLLKRCGLRNTL